MRKIILFIVTFLSCFTLFACSGTNYPGNIKAKYWLSEDKKMMFYFPAEAGRGNAAGQYLADEETIEDIILEWNAKTGVVEVMTAGYEKMFTANTVTDSENLLCTFEITSQEEGYNFSTEMIFHWEETVNFECINNIHVWGDGLVKNPNNGEFHYQCTLCGETSEPEHNDVRNVLDIPELSIDNIVEVRKETGAIGVAPGSLTNITYSSDIEDKDMVLSLLEMTVYEDTTNNWQIPGGGYTLYSIFTNDQRYDIEITNDYISINQKHYKFVGEYISFKYPKLETYGFVSYQETVEVWWNETLICEIPMNELEFKQVDSYVSTEGGIVGSWVVKTEFGDLHFPEPKNFENSNTYELTGLSLFKLVEKYSNWWVSPNGQPVQVEE